MPISPEQRVRLQERAGNLGDAQYACEICGRPGNNAHHRKNAGQGGDDRLSNLLLLCGSGTTGCHGWVTGHPAISKREKGWSVWRSDDPAEVPVRYRGTWCRLDDEGNVHVLQRGQIRNELGHLSIVRRQDAGGKY